MRKFITPAAYKCKSESEFKELLRELELMGYNDCTYRGFSEGPYIGTNYGANRNDIGNFICFEEDYQKNLAESKEEFLALVSMTDSSTTFYPGEAVVATATNNSAQYILGNIYFVKNYTGDVVYTVLDEKCSDGNGWHKKNFRKASKEEIIRHFLTIGKKDAKKQVELSGPEALEEAIKRYPRGTVYRSSENGLIYTVGDYEGTTMYRGHGNNILAYRADRPRVGSFVYYDGKWAEIVGGRKVVGYTAPYDILDWKKGDVFKKYGTYGTYHVEGKILTLPGELVETWEPVYEDEKLMFGGKEVKLELVPTMVKTVSISCDGHYGNYNDCKDLRNAISTIEKFSFSGKKVSSAAGIFNKITIGCTTGTLEEMDTILVACEKLLKKS
jgi:hypothetical protein